MNASSPLITQSGLAVLETDERTFQRLVSGVRDYAIYMLDRDGFITTWNDGARTIKGYHAFEVIGQHFQIFYTEEDVKKGIPGKALRIAIETGRWEAEGQRVRKNGSLFWAAVLIEPIRDEIGDVVGFAKITRDITTQREANRSRAALQERLWEAQKLEALGQLTGGVAHDFNNLLTVILGGLEMAEKEANGNEALRRHHHVIRQAARRGADTIATLLAFARRQALRPDRIDPSLTIRNATNLLTHAMRGDVHIDVDVPGGLHPIEVDPTELELALVNLGMNSRDAMPEGGTLKIRARNAMAGDAEGVPPGRYVEIRVCDTGAGIPPELLGKVLEPFFTTKGVGVGTGLGLSRAYGFARQSGGNLIIHSEIGRGTDVSIFLPAMGAIDGEPKLDRKPRILVVEDDVSLRELVVEMLEEEGYMVTEAGCVADAVAALDGAEFDVVFSDVVMPGPRNGLDLARDLQVSRPSLPVLMTSGYNDAQHTAGNVGLRMLPKPYSMRILTDTLTAMLTAKTGALS